MVGAAYRNPRVPGREGETYIRISPDNTITLAVSKTEMGQGVYTSLPQLVAEELEVPMTSIKVVSI